MSKGFLFFYDWEEPFARLSGEEFKKLFLAMLRYQKGTDELPQFEGDAGLIASFVFPQLSRRKASSRAGEKGMETRWKNGNARQDLNNDVNNHLNNDVNNNLNKVLNNESITLRQRQRQRQDKDEDNLSPLPPHGKPTDSVGLREGEGFPVSSDLCEELPTPPADFPPFPCAEDLEPPPEVPFPPQAELLPEPLPEPPPASGSSKKKRPAPREDPPNEERFERFWSAYPRKIGKDAARKAFAARKVTDELLERMLRAVDAQKRSEQWRRDGGRYVPYPSTWLSRGQWEDDEGEAYSPYCKRSNPHALDDLF